MTPPRAGATPKKVVEGLKGGQPRKTFGASGASSSQAKGPEAGDIPARETDAPLDPEALQRLAKRQDGPPVPKELQVGSASYRELRNGFYIGLHATDRDIAGLFEILAPDYEKKDINVDYNHAVYRRLADLAASAANPSKSPRRVLDFGCGTGVGAGVLGKHFEGAKMLGFDLSPSMRRIAQANGMFPVGETGGKLELTSGSIDVVVSAFVLHLIRSKEWIEELGRVMAPGASASFNVYKPAPGQVDRLVEWFSDSGLLVVSARDDRFIGGGLDVTMPVVVVRKPVGA